MSQEVILVQTAIADYRDEFVAGCCDYANKNNIKFSIVTGRVYFENTTTTSKNIVNHKITTLVKNLFFFGRRVLLQTLPFRRIIRADAVICELNPRIINTWIVVLLRSILGKRTVLWGHAWARNGRHSGTEPIRNILRNSADSLLLYTYTQMNELIARGARGDIYVAPNSLYSRNEIKSVFNESSSSILYVGRLVASKKVGFLIDSSLNFLVENPKASLEIVGDGTERMFLVQKAKDLGLESRVRFHGHISDRSELEKIYSRAFVSVSPGYVGLSITQSFSFGVPMLVSKNENHSPELEALVPGLNGDFFETDNPSSLCAALEKYYHNRNSTSLISADIAKHCRDNYSTERMVEGFYASALGKKS